MSHNHPTSSVQLGAHVIWRRVNGYPIEGYVTSITFHRDGDYAKRTITIREVDTGHVWVTTADHSGIEVLP